MKKIICVILPFLLILSLAACSDEKSDADKKKEEKEKAKREIFIDENYKTQKGLGYRFKLPKAMKYNKELSNSSKKNNKESCYYDEWNESDLLTNRAYIAKNPLGDIEVEDSSEMLEEVLNGIEEAEGVSKVTDPQVTEVAGMDAQQSSYDMKIDGLKFKGQMTVWYEEDSNTIFAMTFLTSKKNLKDFKYVISTIIKDEK